jgi:hypothetical protein
MVKNIERCGITINVYDQLASSALPCETDGSIAVDNFIRRIAHCSTNYTCCASIWFISACGQFRYRPIFHGTVCIGWVFCCENLSLIDT